MLLRAMKSNSHSERPYAWVMDLMVHSWLEMVWMAEVGETCYYNAQLAFSDVLLEKETSISCKNENFVQV